MASEQHIFEQAHCILVEHCVFNGLSHDLINAITRDIYPSNVIEQSNEFHLNIKSCQNGLNCKCNKNINIAHFSQLQWISSLKQRPCLMLPAAHHLIEFFNHINIRNVNNNYTQSIQQQFIIQCFISMDSGDTIEWNKCIKQYSTLLDGCLYHKTLNALNGKHIQSKEFRQFVSNYPWIVFANTLSKWCKNMVNTLELTPNKSLLYQLTQNKNNNNNINNISHQTHKQGKKRSYNEMSECEPISKPQNPRKKAKISNNNTNIVNNKWANWIKKNIDVTLELNNEIYCGKIRKVSMQFVLVKITDDDAPNKYKNRQLKIYIKDQHKIEPIANLDEFVNNNNNNNDLNGIQDINKNRKNTIHTNINNKSIETIGNNKNKTSDKEELSDSENDNNEFKQSTIYTSYKPTVLNNIYMPDRITNKELITNPKRFYGIDKINNKEKDKSKNKHRNESENDNKRKDKKKTDLKSKKNSNNNNEWIWKKLSGNNNIGKPKKKKRKIIKRTEWNKNEINAVINGYKKYKRYENARLFEDGIWGHILKDPQYSKILNINRRTNAQICDKWTYLTKTNDRRIRHLIGDRNKNNKSPRDKMRKLVTRAL